jgi:hypothetical protein
MGNVGTDLPPLPAAWLFWECGDLRRPEFLREIFADFCFRGLPMLRFTGKFSGNRNQ